MELDPNLIQISKCGKYVYPVDSITGAKTFAPIDYFKKSLQEKYNGDLKRFVKEYITRETKKYLKEGHTKEEIKALAAQNNGKLPKLNPKLKPHPDMPKKVRRKRLAAHAETTRTVVNEDGKVETIRTYPWSQDPTNYFRAPAAPVDVAEITKDTCMRPDIYLDDNCYGCKYYSQCQCKLKHPNIQQP